MAIKFAGKQEAAKPGAGGRGQSAKTVKKAVEKIASAKAAKKGAGGKTPVTIRLDKKVVDFFKAQGPGWQGRMNAVLLKEAGLEG